MFEEDAGCQAGRSGRRNANCFRTLEWSSFCAENRARAILKCWFNPLLDREKALVTRQ